MEKEYPNRAYIIETKLSGLLNSQIKVSSFFSFNFESNKNPFVSIKNDGLGFANDMVPLHL